jgi:hypothetical protein
VRVRRAQKISKELVRQRYIAGETSPATEQPVIFPPANGLAYTKACGGGCNSLVHCLISRSFPALPID